MSGGQRIRYARVFTYDFLANDGEKNVCNVRGFSLNFHDSQLSNFQVISAIILQQGEPVVNVHPEHKLKRKRKAGGTVAIVTESE